MKKVLFYAAAIVAMLATAACSNKELTPTPDDLGAVLNIRISSTSAGDTKTGVEYDSELKAHLPYWNTGDQIGVFFDGFGSKTKLDAVLANTSADKASEASFSAENITLNNGTVPGAEGRIYSFYPASAFQTNGVVEDDNAVRVNLIGVQNPAAVDTYDPAADILVGQPSDYMYEEGLLVADVAFARAMSIVKVTLKAGSECPDNLAVNSFTMTAPEGTILTGRAKLSLAALYDDASPILDWTVDNNAVTAKYDANFHPVIGGAENTVYVVVNPTSIASGNIVFNIDTDGYTIEKTVTLSKALTFPQSNVANIGLTIDGSNCTPKVTETRILVESFSGVTSSGTRVQPSVTGATGTGLNQDTAYDFGSDNNTNIRFNSNGHSSSDPYLYLRANATFTISKISVSEESMLQFSTQTKNAGSVTLKYKESSSEDWTTVDTWTTAAAFGEQNSIFSISSSATSLDFSLTAGGAAVIVDDIVIERYVDTRETLAAPANIVASVDAETPNRINISWDAVEHADKYEVVLSASDEEDVVFEPTTNSVAATGLTYEKEYSIKVKAVTTDIRNYKDSDYANAASTVTTGSKPSVTSGWIKKNIVDISSTDIVVIVGSGYGIQNDNGTSGAPACVEVTIADNAITSEVPNNIMWNIDGNAQDGYIFYVNGDNTKWLYCNTTADSKANDNIRVGTGDRKAWKINSNGYYENTVGGSNKYVKRILSQNNTTDWRSYINENTYPQILEFYVYQDDRESQTLSYSVATGTWDMYTNTGSLPTLDASGAYTTIEYSSSDETVATVNAATGAITALKTGTTTITATAVGDATYKKATASYKLTITDSTPILTLKKENVNVNASAVNDAKIEAAYDLANATDLDVVVSKDGNITSASISGGTVTYSISANEDENNTAISHIYLTLNGDKKTITITQAKNVTLPNGFEVTSYTSVPNGWTASNTSNITQYNGYFFLGGGDTLTSCTCDLSSFSTATISVSVRTYGQCSTKSIDISYSTDGGANWTSSTITISNSYATKNVTISQPSSNVIVKFKSTESTNGVGARLQTLKLTGSN